MIMKHHGCELEIIRDEYNDLRPGMCIRKNSYFVLMSDHDCKIIGLVLAVVGEFCYVLWS